LHTDALIVQLVESMVDVWQTLKLPFVEPAKSSISNARATRAAPSRVQARRRISLALA